MVSGAFSQLDQYKANRDTNGTWRVIDMFNPEVQQFGPDDDIPDTSPAVILVKEGAFLALVKEATKIGILQTAMGEANVEASAYEAIKQQLEEAKEKLAKAENAALEVSVINQELNKIVSAPKSESFHIKSKVIDTLLKLSGMSAVSEVE